MVKMTPEHAQELKDNATQGEWVSRFVRIPKTSGMYKVKCETTIEEWESSTRFDADTGRFVQSYVKYWLDSGAANKDFIAALPSITEGYIQATTDLADTTAQAVLDNDTIQEQAKQVDGLNGQLEVANDALGSEYKKNDELTAFISSQDKHILEQAKQIDELKAHVRRFHEALALTNSMINGGEQHSEQSEAVIRAAFDNTPSKSLQEHDKQVRADERERCAKVCEELYCEGLVYVTLFDCAEAIRNIEEGEVKCQKQQ